jgi:hypothetical protein
MKIRNTFLGFEVLTEVGMKISIPCDITPCSPSKFNRRFGETCSLHLQGRVISEARNQCESGTALLARCLSLFSFLAYYSTLKMEPTCFSKTSVDFPGLHALFPRSSGTLSLRNTMLSLCLSHEGVRGSGGLGSRILNFDSR